MFGTLCTVTAASSVRATAAASWFRCVCSLVVSHVMDPFVQYVSIKVSTRPELNTRLFEVVPAMAGACEQERVCVESADEGEPVGPISVLRSNTTSLALAPMDAQPLALRTAVQTFGSFVFGSNTDVPDSLGRLDRSSFARRQPHHVATAGEIRHQQQPSHVPSASWVRALVLFAAVNKARARGHPTTRRGHYQSGSADGGLALVLILPHVRLSDASAQ